MTVSGDAPDQAVTHMLVVSADKGAVNRLISNLRHEGMALRASGASDSATLKTLLNQEQWDVLVAFDDAGVKLDDILSLLHKHEQDTPVIYVTADAGKADLQAMYRQGVRDMVSGAETGRLITSILREAERYTLRKQLRRQEVRQQELESRHQQLLTDSPVAISYLRDGVHLYCNRSYAELFGYESTDTIRTTPFLNLVAASQRAQAREILADAQLEAQGGELLCRRQDGSEKELRLTLTPVEYHGKPCLQVTVQAIAGNAAYSAQVDKLAKQDLLTRLDNSAYFRARIENAIRTAVQQGDFSTLLLLEVNDFSDISAAIGRANANLVLNDIALFLQNTLSAPYAAGRIDDHVFGILLYDGDPDAALSLCRSLREQINNRVSTAMLSSLELSCSAGMALINGHALNADDILDRARLNLKQAPSQEGAAGQFHIGESLKVDAGGMLNYLKTALAEKRFKLVFQPIVGINGVAQGFYEVLIRMLDTDGNDILPGAFLPLADLNGMGEEIDRLVVTMTLESLRTSDKVQHLAVNITTNTLVSQTFLPWLSEKLAQTRIQADRLVIDISEIALHNSVEAALAFCRGLDELGVGLAVSHFGCAVDPFAMLDKLHPRFVTLDETLIRDLIYSSQQKTNIVTLVNDLHSRQLQAIAPRVEDMAVLPLLWEVGVDFVQGYCVQAPSNEMNYEFVQDEEITLTATPE